MRRGLVIFLLINFFILVFLVRSVFTLITLLFEDASADAILLSEIPALNSTLPLDNPNTPPQLIPQIIHQTYKDTSIPTQWQPAQKSCLDLHPDYEYKLWTDASAHDFIAAQYPWFLPTLESYPYPIQRADAIRYFVLAHYGGIYIDLDDGCHRRLDPLLAFPAWVRRTVPTGISNDAMGATPNHPFFVRVTESLQSYNRAWFLPYITIMYSTGPLFLSVIWKQWMTEHANPPPSWPGRVRILMKPEYNSHPWSFFEHYPGSSWHGRDARLIFWMGRNWMLLTALGFMVAGVLGMALWWAWGRILGLGARRRPGGAVRKRSPSPRTGGGWVWARWRRGRKEREYELLDQRDR